MAEKNFYVYNTFFSKSFFDIDENNKLKFKHDMSFGNDFLESWKPEWDKFLQYANDFRDALNEKHAKIDSGNIDEICADLINKQRMFLQQGMKMFSRTERFYRLWLDYHSAFDDVQNMQEEISRKNSEIETLNRKKDENLRMIGSYESEQRPQRDEIQRLNVDLEKVNKNKNQIIENMVEIDQRINYIKTKGWFFPRIRIWFLNRRRRRFESQLNDLLTGEKERLENEKSELIAKTEPIRAQIKERLERISQIDKELNSKSGEIKLMTDRLNDAKDKAEKDIETRKEEIDDFWKQERIVTSYADISEKDESPNPKDFEIKNIEEAASFISDFGEQSTLMLSNRAFIENLRYKYPNELQITGKSISEILSDPQYYYLTGIKMIQKPQNAKTDHGKISEVYQTHTGEFVKPGEFFIKHNYNDIAPVYSGWKSFDEMSSDEQNRAIRYSQNDGMGNFGGPEGLNMQFRRYGMPQKPSILPTGAGYAIVDSSSRQTMQNIVAESLGFYDLIVPTETAIDNVTGNVTLMEPAKGLRGDSCVLVPVDNTNIDPEVKRTVSNKGLTAVPFTPELQIEFLKLGIVDYICMQGDRNFENIFISDKVCAIDNDFIAVIANESIVERLLPTFIPFLTESLRGSLIEKLNSETFISDIKKKLAGVFNGLSREENLSLTFKAIETLKKYINEHRIKIIPDKELSADTARRIMNANQRLFRAMSYDHCRKLPDKPQDEPKPELENEKGNLEKPKNIAK